MSERNFKAEGIAAVMIPKAGSFGFKARRATGMTAAKPAASKAFGSVLPVVHRATAAARNERPYEANIAVTFGLSFIYYSLLFIDVSKIYNSSTRCSKRLTVSFIEDPPFGFNSLRYCLTINRTIIATEPINETIVRQKAAQSCGDICSP